ncbi:hypothetical protein M8J76_000816 [Diaphorina citri]|nr:hypothetical protein M8J76_000816 [Diaphorina citri]
MSNPYSNHLMTPNQLIPITNVIRSISEYHYLSTNINPEFRIPRNTIPANLKFNIRNPYRDQMATANPHQSLLRAIEDLVLAFKKQSLAFGQLRATLTSNISASN